jgi:hypothetical protein
VVITRERVLKGIPNPDFILFYFLKHCFNFGYNIGNRPFFVKKFVRIICNSDTGEGSKGGERAGGGFRGWIRQSVLGRQKKKNDLRIYFPKHIS